MYEGDTHLLVMLNEILFLHHTVMSNSSLLSNGVLSGRRQFLAAESPLKMMKNAFYFTLKVLFVLKVFKFLSLLLGHV